MRIREKNGFVGIDMLLSIMGIIIFSGLIFSLMYSNALENAKIRKEALATIYLTETLENVGILSYDEVNQDNIDNGSLIPVDMSQNYEMNIEIITDNLSISNSQKNDDILKKVIATISYKVGNKDYELSMQRVKMKE